MGIFRAAMTSVVSRCVDNLNSSTDFRALFDKLDHFKNNSVCKRSLENYLYCKRVPRGVFRLDPVPLAISGY